MAIQPLQSIFPALNNLIRQVVLNNENNLLSTQTNVAGNQQNGAQPNNQVAQNTSSNPQLPIDVVGANKNQVAQVAVNSLGSSGAASFQGQVLSPATAATLMVQGSAGAVAVASGHYELAGNQGSTDLYLNAGESLYSVATNINQVTGQTGVSAAVSGNNLVLTSNQVGSSSLVSLQPYGASAQFIHGLNAQQINSFNVLSQTPGTTDSIAGTVNSSAEGAQLVYQGALGATVAGSATFQLTGSRGSTNVSLSQGESLSGVASRINQQTTSTGVIAVVSGNNLLLSSDTTGTSAKVKIDSVTQSSSTTTTGLNSAQISGVSVSSLNSGAHEVLSGNVLHAASGAAISLQGAANGTVIDTATFNLTGSSGSTPISIQQGESLAAVASQVNALTNTTGVVAQVDNNQVVFQSVNVGSTARVDVQLTNISHSNVVSGVNSQQLANFSVNSLTTGATDSLSGQISNTATQASLTLAGNSSGNVVDTATFNLTGSTGTAQISITQGQSLASVASQINALTNSTGVVAQVSSNQILFKSVNVGSSASVGVQLTSINHTNVVSGVNAQQLSGFTVNNFTTGASETFNGQVSRAAAQAEVSLQGSSSGTVVDTNTFNLTGSVGTAQISITQGQTLASVVTQVNALTNSTGVVARVSGNQVVFDSTAYGSSQSVALKLANVTHATTVSGVNSQQVASFNVDSFATGASQTLSGTVNQAATNSQLTFTGSSGTVHTNSTFTLSGSLGSAVFTTTSSETLTTLATQINASTATTGVQAVVSGNSLTLQSSGVGSSSVVGVNATTGTFSVSGGNGNGTANGTNAVATVNGQTISGSGNTFQLTDSFGTYSFTTASGYTGAISPISINQVDKLTGSTFATTVSGVNSQQLTNVQASTLAAGDTQTLSGTVTQTASSAQLTFASALGLITSGSTFTLSGSLGSAVFSTTGLESISTLASQINAATATTGVQAVISGSNVNLVSTGIGSSASVAVKVSSGTFNTTGGFGNGTASGTNAQAVINGQSLTGNGNAFQFSDSKGTYSFNTVAGFTGAINTVNVGQVIEPVNAAYTISTTGVNAGQVANFQADSFANGASNSLSGTVTKSGTSAQLTYTGTGGKAHTNSTFTLTGSLGSTSITTTNSESLTTVAAQINSSTASTGVQAVVAGNTLTLQSADLGSGASVSVNATSGSFNVTGGYGNGTAAGTDAQAVINGQTLKGNGNTFQFSDAVGNYSLTTAAGYTGAISAINVASTVGQFNVTGGHGDGTANGVDAQATVNGQNLTGNGNSFQFTDALGSYSFQTTQGFTGTLSPISVVSQAGQFNLTGGNGNGTATGTDAHAVVNGQTLTGAGNSFQYTDSKGSYSFSAVPGFTGTFNTVNVASQAGQFTLSGGDGSGNSSGTDVQANINGVQVTGTGNLVSFSDPNGAYQIQFANGFAGTFSPVTIQSNLGTFNISGGDGAGTSNGTNFSATINGVQYTGTTNFATIAGSHGTYSVNFANGFVGNIDPITISNSNSENVVSGGIDGVDYGTDAVALINGVVRTGNGSTFTVNQNGTQATIGFADGFSGTFNPIVVSRPVDAPAAPGLVDNSSTASQPSSSGTNSSVDAANLRLIQLQINQQFIQSELNGLSTWSSQSSGIAAFTGSHSTQTNSNSQSSEAPGSSDAQQGQSKPIPSFVFSAAAAPSGSGTHVNSHA